jgi:protein-L-isoaspartate(D-aspartate) O-methyltransferase
VNERTGIGMTSARTRDRLIAALERQGIDNAEVLEAMRSVPRHMFVDEALGSRAYENTVLPIGHGQTISQPYIVALMTQALIADRPSPIAKVLEIGSGCGYQTAVLARFARHVFSVERIGPLVRRARENMRALGIQNVSMRHADGTNGWPSQAPFHGILIAAAPETVPDRLLEQLDDGARLIMPAGVMGRQELISITRKGDEFVRQSLIPVSFVPMLSGMEQ